MVTLILGKKGSGKTKKLMDQCNTAVAQSKGNVVFIEKDNTLTYDLSHQVRLVSAADFGICGELYKVTPLLIEAIKAAKAAK